MATLESIEAQIEALQAGIIGRLDDIDTAIITLQSGVIGRFDDVDANLESLIMHNKCAVCQGDGEVNTPVEGEPGPPYTCPRCGGDGSIKVGNINTTGDD